MSVSKQKTLEILKRIIENNKYVVGDNTIHQPIFIVLDKKSGTNNQHLVCQMVIAVFSKYMSQIGFVDSQILGSEHFVNGTHAAKIIVLVTSQKVYMYYLSSHFLFF